MKKKSWPQASQKEGIKALDKFDAYLKNLKVENPHEAKN
jgi:hypothetical protein